MFLPGMPIHNPLVNPVCDIFGRNRTIQDVEEACKRQQLQEEYDKKLKEHDAKKKLEKGLTMFDVETKGTFENLP